MYINPLSIPCQYMPGFYVHPDYPMYSVNCNGDVYSYFKKRLINGSLSLYGYKIVACYDASGNVKYNKVHRLVAFHFVPLPDIFNGDYSKATVDHIDGNRLNNYYTNLEWVTLRENVNRAWNSEIYGNQLSGIVIVDKVDRRILHFSSIVETERTLGLYHGSVNNCLLRKGKGYIAGRYIAGYANDPEFTSKLTNIDAMIMEANANTIASMIPVIIVDKITRTINRYSSMAEAERALMLREDNIGKYLRSFGKKGYVAGRYIAGSAIDQEFITRLNNIDVMIAEADVIARRLRPVICYDNLNNTTIEYPSIAECSRQINVDKSAVKAHLLNGYKSPIHGRYSVTYKN